MSDFESKCLDCNYVFDDRKGPCPKCGCTRTKVISMDGHSSREWDYIEADNDNMGDGDGDE
jgi:hypothetical protein